MTAPVTGIGAAWQPAELPPPIAEPPLRSLWGLLSVQVQAGPGADELDSPHLEAALRMINGTEIGAALLREIATCDIPAGDRPVIALDGPADPGPAAFTDDAAAANPFLIHFTVESPPSSPAGTPADTDDGIYPAPGAKSAIDLFVDLATYLASRTGQLRQVTSLGYGDYSTLAFQEQLGSKIPQWQYTLEAYVRAPAHPDEDRATVWETVNQWYQAGDPHRPLQLHSLNLRACPPLREVPGLAWLVLADNALTAFPSLDQLPSTLTQIDLAGNPIVTPPDGYGAQLRHVTLDKTVCENTALRGTLSPDVELVEADADYIETYTMATRFVTEFPETMVDMLPVEAMERAGWVNAVMAPLYPKDMLENAAANWFAPRLPGEVSLAPTDAAHAWRHAQQIDANGAAALTAMLDRLHEGWSLHPDPAFRQRFVTLLAKMCTRGNEDFLEECLGIAREGASSCDDQILYTVNSLHIASLNADVMAGKYDLRLVELMHHAEDMLNVHTLTQFFSDLRPELERRAREKDVPFDEVEQWLHLHSLLQRVVHLPTMLFRMQFTHLSVVNDGDVQAARAAIANAKNTGFLDFLASWSPLQSVIRRTAPRLAERADRWRDHIYNHRGRVYGTLDRLMGTDGQLFAAGNGSDIAIFRVGPRMFRTRFERLVDKRLAAHGLDRGTPDVLPPVCRAVDKDMQALIRKTTAREFLNMYGLKLEQAIQDIDQPRWFKRLRKKVR